VARGVHLASALRRGTIRTGRRRAGGTAVDIWMGWAMIAEGLLFSMLLALTLTWSALRAVFHLMPVTSRAPRLAPALTSAPHRTPARAA
jgi:hypothetical protein